MFQRLLSLALIAGTVATAGQALAQELSIERPDGDGQVIDLGRSPVAPQELPKASGFPELGTPDEPPLPYIKEDTETIVLPPPANVVDPEPVKPVVKTPAKPAVKAPAKPVVKTPAKPVVKKPVEPAVKEAPAKPVVKVPARPAVEPKPVPAPKITAKPKPAVPLPRTKPNSIAKQSKPTENAALPKAPVPKKPTLKKPVNKAPAQTTVIPKTLVPKNIVPKTPVPEAPVQKAVVPKTLVPKTIVPKNLVPKTPVAVTPAPVLPEPELTAPQDAEIEINQLESIPSVSANATPSVVESGPILDIPIVGVEVAPEPEEQPVAPQKRKSNRVDRN